MKISNILTFILISGLFLPLAVDASSVVRSGETVSIETDQKIEGDFYTAASVLSISGEITDDFISIAGRNTLNGKVGKDALMIGASVDVHGPVGEDLRVVAADVIIAEPVTGDVFVIADTVKVLSTASIGGDLVVYGGTVEVSGSVGGNILGHYDTLRVDAPVAKGIDITVNRLTLGDRAEVTEHVRYTSSEQLTRSQNTKIGGDITRGDVIVDNDERPISRTFMIGLLIVLFTVLAWFLVARKLLVATMNRALVRGMRPLLLGFITFFAAPVIIAVLTVSIIGTVVGVAALFAYIVLVIMALVGAIAVIGTLALRTIQKNHILSVTPLSIVVGTLIAAGLLFVPILGPILLMLAMLVTLGALVDLLLHTHSA